MRIITTSFKDSEADIRTIRDKVFGEEQNVPDDIEWDGKDEDAIHTLAYIRNKPVGTGRMTADGKIGRLAILKEYRCKGIGGKMLDALIEEAKKNGLQKLYLHAQTHAIWLYEKRGFIASGNLFMEAGIEHIYMSLDL